MNRVASRRLALSLSLHQSISLAPLYIRFFKKSHSILSSHGKVYRGRPRPLAVVRARAALHVPAQDDPVLLRPGGLSLKEDTSNRTKRGAHAHPLIHASIFIGIPYVKF